MCNFTHYHTLQRDDEGAVALHTTVPTRIVAVHSQIGGASQGNHSEFLFLLFWFIVVFNNSLRFVWSVPFGPFRLVCFVWSVSFGLFRLVCFVCLFRLVCFVWSVPFGLFRLVCFVLLSLCIRVHSQRTHHITCACSLTTNTSQCHLNAPY
jgi:hypothetical protein